MDEVTIRDGRHLASVLASIRRQIYGTPSAIVATVQGDLTELELKVRSDIIAFDIALERMRTDQRASQRSSQQFTTPHNPLWFDPPKIKKKGNT